MTSPEQKIPGQKIHAPLSGPVQHPSNGQAPAKLIMLLHGLGADGQDLIPLAHSLAADFPDTLFFAPDAPYPCDMAPFGRQWFSLRDWSHAAMRAGVEQAAPVVLSTVAHVQQQYGLKNEQTALLGFSQGAMVALRAGLESEPPLAGIASFSGALVHDIKNVSEAQTPVCFIHGDSDPLVPVAETRAAFEQLKKRQCRTEIHIRPGLEHGIDPAGLDKAATFLHTAFKQP